MFLAPSSASRPSKQTPSPKPSLRAREPVPVKWRSTVRRPSQLFTIPEKRVLSPRELPAFVQFQEGEEASALCMTTAIERVRDVNPDEIVNVRNIHSPAPALVSWFKRLNLTRPWKLLTLFLDNVGTTVLCWCGLRPHAKTYRMQCHGVTSNASFF